MASVRRRGGLPPIDGGEVRFRVWVALVSGLLAGVLLTYVGHRVAVETAAYAAYRSGTLVPTPAEVREVDYSSAVGGYGGNGSAQEVRYRLPGGGDRVSTMQSRATFLDVEEGQVVRLGMLHGHLVTVEGQYVRHPWTPGAALLFLFLPPAFVLTALQVYRLWRLRRERPKYLFGDNLSFTYVRVAALLAFGTGLVTVSMDHIPWIPVPAFVISALGPLAWFTTQEIIERRANARGRL
ncbi:hypothetical protein ABT008_26920 [Micromonospora sp. NPDC002389]|uniref:hypothetical protein n=1 Tax=Micromonospora sp. NPDC002389 TaxID=3154272 RepID=UPI003328207D